MKELNIKSRGFDFEPEVTAKVHKRGMKICEVPISYHGRPFHEGKKINRKDGLIALLVLLRYRIFD